MRRIFVLTLALAGALVLVAGISAAEASTKFAYTEEVTQTGTAIVRFEEGSLKRFDGLDYQLEATAVATWVSPCGGRLLIEATFPSVTLALIPDAKGRVSGTLTLDLSPPMVTPCEVLQHVEYTSMTLTNLTTGHMYRLDPISQDYP